MFPQVMLAVSSELPPAEAARLQGYRRYTVTGQVYPALARSPGSIVDGVLYHDLSRRLMARLDRYEGSEYRRSRLRVTNASGLQAFAWVYVPRRFPDSESAQRDWIVTEFETQHLDRWCRQLHRTQRHPTAR